MKTPIYKEKYPRLFEPLTIGRGKAKLTYKNRFLVAPIAVSLSCDQDGYFTEEGLKFYGNFINGGFAGICVPVEIPFNGGHPRSLVLNDEKGLSYANMHPLQYLAHAQGALTMCEIYHPGCCQLPGAGKEILSADTFIYNGRQVRGMNKDDMEIVADMYAEAAMYAKRAGFDILNLHFAHGWLMHNFLSPLSNHRKDEFGGSVENRCRFPLMVIERIRQKVGDMPIELRLNGTDGEDQPGGITIEDAVQQALIFEEHVDMIHMCCGNRLNASSRPEMFPSHFLAPGHNAPASEALKKAGIKIPVGVVGNVHEPQFAEQLLKEGKADYIVMLRQAICDSEFVNKIKEDREEDIRPCIHCNLCIDSGRRKAISTEVDLSNTATYDARCSVNPFWRYGGVGRRLIPEPKKSKKVAVIGGGIAGMQAAITAAQRGHEVTLYEKENVLGGQVLFADYESFKYRIKMFKEYLITQMKKANVKVLLNTLATPELIEKNDYDAAIVAVGAEQIVPAIPGISNANVVMSMDVFGNEEKLGKKVVIVGGGMLGCELAIHLGNMAHEVIVVEMGQYLAATGELCQRTHTLKYMKEAGVVDYTNTQCMEITPKGIYVKTPEGQKFIEADNVIISVGTKPLAEERDKFKDVAFEVINIGDCKVASNISNAVYTGYDAAAIL